MGPTGCIRTGLCGGRAAGSPNGTGETRNVALQFRREQLLYDIANYGFIEGDLMAENPDDHARHLTQDVAEVGNVDRITRILGLVHAGVIEMLYPYTKFEAEDGDCLNDRLREPEVYMVEMAVPPTVSMTTIHYLEHLIHEYMVARAIADWLSITNPRKAPVWAEKVEAIEQSIRTCMIRRMQRTRIKQHPF